MTTFLHGKLAIKIIAARNVEGKAVRDRSMFSTMERLLSASLDGVDPYCSVRLAYNNVVQTPVVYNDPNPYWNTSVEIDVAHEVENLEFRVKAAKRKGPLSIISKVMRLSMLCIPATEIVEKKLIEGWLPLSSYTADDDDDEETDEVEEREQYGELLIEVCYQPISEIGPAIEEVGLQKSYYQIREGCDVVLYQNADVPPGTLPEIPFHPEYQYGRCWLDISKALMESTAFIYISGWSVWTEVVLVRTEGEEYFGMTLGEILKQKAEEGIVVCILVWDELASTMFSAGLMGTHDEDLVKYFADSKVSCRKVSRKNDAEGPFADLNDSIMFTHHQKTVVTTRVDPDSGKHRVEAWLGGLDLTDGRYDTPEHSLFRTLQGVHAPPDFWQACAAEVGAASGPREPWHDIHTKVRGAVAWDVVENFTGRWYRQAEDHVDDMHSMLDDDFVIDDDEDEIQDGSWNVQLLRSINQCSAILDTERSGLTVRQSALVDRSIHVGYVHAIRRAKSFIYIENQYFLGSSHMWSHDSGQRGGFANHLVAIELAEKICAKIRANERFAVYVVVPMFPEGAPDSGAVQEILSHQKNTVSMITSRIAATIRETESDTSVSDWFNMFCLVNRESPEGGQGNGGEGEKEQLLSATRRFMVYVHSKFMLVDDTVTIIGSANINSRSMDGSRDSEIATMSWQPEHVASGSTAYGEDLGVEAELPKGDVAAFRCGLWSAILGGYFDEMEDPASLECVAKVREMAQENWENFAMETDEPADMPHGHLAYYPYHYDPVSGEAMASTEHFPDFPTAPVGGTCSVIPNMLTG